MNLNWRKARRCGTTSCVEMAIQYAKSSYSADSANCVEVGRTAEVVYVRDSKAGGDGTVLAFTPDAWRTFLANPIEWPKVA